MESECIIMAGSCERETSRLMARRQRKNEKKLFFSPFFFGVMCQGVNTPAEQTEEVVPDVHEQLWRS